MIYSFATGDWLLLDITIIAVIVATSDDHVCVKVEEEGLKLSCSTDMDWLLFQA